MTRRFLVLILALTLGTAVPVTAAPVLSGCNMPAMMAAAAPSSSCPSGACECQLKTAPSHALLGVLSSVSVILNFTPVLYSTPALNAPAPAQAAGTATVSVLPPSLRKLYDLYSDYRI